MAAAPQLLSSGRVRLGPLRATSVFDEVVRRVLLVDPDPRSRSILSAQFFRKGFEVTAFGTAEEANRHLLWAASLPAVIVSELTLPGGHGLFFASQLQSDPRTSSVPVVLMAKDEGQELVERALTLGVSDVLRRPLFVADVVSQVLLRAEAATADATLDVSDEVSLPFAIRALLSGVRTGRVYLGTRGHIAFRQGEVVDASFDSFTGEAALIRAFLLWTEAFSISFKSSSLSAVSMSLKLERFEEAVWPQLHAWNALHARGVPQDARLVVDFNRLKDALAGLPEGIDGILRWFDGRRTVREVVEQSPFGELTTLEAATRLYAMTILVPAPAVRTEGLRLAQMPAEFEPLSHEGVTSSVVVTPELNAHVHVFPAPDANKSVRKVSLSALWRRVAIGAVSAAMAGAVAYGVGARKRSVASSPMALVPVQAAKTQQLIDIPEMDSAYFSPQFQKAVAHYNAKHPELAATLLSRFVDEHPESSVGWMFLALSRYDNKDSAGAEIAARHALDLNPLNGRALLLSATLEIEKGQKTEASAKLRRYLEAEPNGSFAAEVKGLLTSL